LVVGKHGVELESKKSSNPSAESPNPLKYFGRNIINIISKQKQKIYKMFENFINLAFAF